MLSDLYTGSTASINVNAKSSPASNTEIGKNVNTNVTKSITMVRLALCSQFHSVYSMCRIVINVYVNDQ